MATAKKIPAKKATKNETIKVSTLEKKAVAKQATAETGTHSANVESAGPVQGEQPSSVSGDLPEDGTSPTVDLHPRQVLDGNEYKKYCAERGIPFEAE